MSKHEDRSAHLPSDIATLYQPRPMRKLSEAEALRMLTEKKIIFHQVLAQIDEKRITGLKELEKVVFTR